MHRLTAASLEMPKLIVCLKSVRTLKQVNTNYYTQCFGIWSRWPLPLPPVPEIHQNPSFDCYSFLLALNAKWRFELIKHYEHRRVHTERHWLTATAYRSQLPSPCILSLSLSSLPKPNSVCFRFERFTIVRRFELTDVCASNSIKFKDVHRIMFSPLKNRFNRWLVNWLTHGVPLVYIAALLKCFC